MATVYLWSDQNLFTLDIARLNYYSPLVQTATYYEAFTYDFTNSLQASGLFRYDAATGALSSDSVFNAWLESFSGVPAYQVSDVSITQAALSYYADAHLTTEAQQFILSGPDAIVGSTFADDVRGYDGNDYVFGGGFGNGGGFAPGSGNDTLDGGAGNDGLWGADGNDRLIGGAGSDGLVGGAGHDLLDGGDDSDFLFAAEFAADGSFLAGAGNDTLLGGGGRDGIWGGDGADSIDAGSGDDYADAREGPDVVAGGDGNDTLLGQDGDDTIGGGTGSDYLYGGAGSDSFVFQKGDGADWVIDFNPAADSLKLVGFGFAGFAALAASLVDGSTPDHPATILDIVDPATGAVDELRVFGAAPTDLNAGNVLLA